jgi:Protein of unknown function (DUF2800)
MWPTMNQRFPQDEIAEAIEGTAAHWTALQIYRNETPPPGAKAPNGVIATDEMVEGGEILANAVRLQLQIFGIEVHIEEPISIPLFQSFGTPDYWGARNAGRGWHIHIIDYKFGHRFVDEFWNEQGLSYLDGILAKLNLNGDLNNFITVSFTIVQPRCFYRGSAVRTHTFTVAEARPHFNRLAIMAEAARTNPLAVTNDHCWDCPGRHACPALQQASYSDAEFSNGRTPVELAPNAAALELRYLMRAQERLEARIDGLKEQTIANIKAGKAVPHFRIEQGYGRTTWNVPDAQILAIGSLYGQDLSKPGVVTPSQAKAKGIDEAVIKAHSFIPLTSLKLIPDQTADAEKVFGKSYQEK